jgi:hypothetical protein
VGIEPASSNNVATGRGQNDLPASGQQRSGQQNRGADFLRHFLGDLGASDVGHFYPPVAGILTRFDASSQIPEDVEQDLDILYVRDVPENHFLIGEDGGGNTGKGGVFIAAGGDASIEGMTAFYKILMHGPSFPNFP